MDSVSVSSYKTKTDLLDSAQPGSPNIQQCKTNSKTTKPRIPLVKLYQKPKLDETINNFVTPCKVLFFMFHTLRKIVSNLRPKLSSFAKSVKGRMQSTA